MLGKSIGKNSFILGLFALLTAGVLAATFMLTAERIEAAQKRAAEKALLEIIPRERHDNDMLQDVYTPTAANLERLGLKTGSVIHIARRNGEPVAAIIPTVAPDGYSGEISLIVGVDVDGSVAGVRVLSHKETPGLGDKIDLNKSNWILGFDGKSLLHPQASGWQVKKDGGEFDQFTGATITPRAVVDAVYRTLEYFSRHKNTIFGIDEELASQQDSQ